MYKQNEDWDAAEKWADVHKQIVSVLNRYEEYVKVSDPDNNASAVEEIDQGVNTIVIDGDDAETAGDPERDEDTSNNQNDNTT